ncbi:MAG: serine protease [Candidatus Obscuribacterales bacterium]|nr:serine protease [Candidatus Obscuribacterales bacterium]
MQTKAKETLQDDFARHPYLTTGALLAGAAAISVVARPFAKSIIAGLKDEFAIDDGFASTLMSPSASSNPMLRQAQRDYQKSLERQMTQAVTREKGFTFKNQPVTSLTEDLNTDDGKSTIPVALLWRKSPVHVAADNNSWLAETFDIAKKTVFRVESSDGTHMGSGFFSSAEGHFLSARHVFEHSGNGQIRMADDTVYPFHVLARDSNADVGLAKVLAPEGSKFEFLKLGKPTRVESVRAAGIGYPGAEPHHLPIISPGRIRGVGYGEDASAFFTMHVDPGNSGGPIIGKEREVLSLVQSGDTPSNFYKNHWIPGRAYGPTAEHMQALIDVHATKGLPKSDYLHVSSNTLPAGHNRALLITDKEFDEVLANPTRKARVEKRHEVQIKSANYWSDY